MTVLLSDEDVRARLTAPQAVAWMGEAIDAHHRGDLIAPPRVHAELGDGRLVSRRSKARRGGGRRRYDAVLRGGVGRDGGVPARPAGPMSRG